jgi:ABC transporter DrrB family efflux protein
VRTPQLIVFLVVQQLLFFLLFYWVFGGSIAIPGLTYINFLAPAFLAQVAIYDGFGVAVGLAEDAKSGLIDRFRALPMARSAFVSGRAIADMLRQIVIIIVLLAVAFVLGFGFNNDAGSIVVGFALLLVFGFSLFWVFAALGLAVRDSETAQAVGTPFFLLSFLSTAFVQVDTLPEWLQPFARNQPISMLTNATRGLFEGKAAEQLYEHPTSYYVWATLIWSVALVAVFAPLAVRIYRHR